MTDATFQALTRSIEQAPKNTPLLERWVDRAKELQRELSFRVLSLSRYTEELPESSYVTYADALTDALRDAELRMSSDDMLDVVSKTQQFAKRLEEYGYADKAAMVREAIEQKLAKVK